MATPISYTPLEGNTLSSIGGNVSELTSINTPSFSSSSSLIWTFAFVVIIVTASFRYAFAGMLRIQASEEGIRKSKEEFKRVTYGLLGVLGLWLVLATFNKDMLSGDVGLSALRSSTIVSGRGGDYAGGGATGVTNAPTISNANESSVRTLFTNTGITINKPPCTGTETGCTNVGGLQQNIINAVIDLKSKCSCAIQITGGSEPGGHSDTSNHTTGNAVDISLTPELTSFFTTNSNVLPIGNTPPCNIKYGFSGLVFWDEAPGCDKGKTTTRHFHASVTGR